MVAYIKKKHEQNDNLINITVVSNDHLRPTANGSKKTDGGSA